MSREKHGRFLELKASGAESPEGQEMEDHASGPKLTGHSFQQSKENDRQMFGRFFKPVCRNTLYDPDVQLGALGLGATGGLGGGLLSRITECAGLTGKAGCGAGIGFGMAVSTVLTPLLCCAVGFYRTHRAVGERLAQRKAHEDAVREIESRIGPGPTSIVGGFLQADSGDAEDAENTAPPAQVYSCPSPSRMSC